MILAKASFKLQLRSPKLFLLSFLTPLAYTVIFLIQITLNYTMVAAPFINLSLGQYLVVFFALQATVFMAFDQSQRFVAKEILSGGFDYMLIRPINLFYFKYFRVPSLHSLLMVVFYVTATIVTAIAYKIPTRTAIQIVVFAFFAGFVIVNIRSGMRGLVFFLRDILNTSRVEESMNIFVINKPPEVFPLFLKTMLTLIFPFVVVHNNAFDLIRGQNVLILFSLLVVWALVAVTFNKTVWHFGLKRYESG